MDEIDALTDNAVTFVRSCDLAERLGPQYVEWLTETLLRVEEQLSLAASRADLLDA